MGDSRGVVSRRHSTERPAELGESNHSITLRFGDDRLSPVPEHRVCVLTAPDWNRLCRSCNSDCGESSWRFSKTALY
jgi:hypothetical protein